MLSALIALPLLGAILICLVPGDGERFRQVALSVVALTAALTVALFFQFVPGNTGMQFTEYLPWFPALGLNYSLGVDGLSLPLLGLNALLTWVVVYSRSFSGERPRFWYALLLLVSAGMVGAFVAQNLLLFFLFYELQLIPLYLLIAIWGGERRLYAAMKFLIYTAVSRSEERRVGKECDPLCRSRWSPYH